MRRALGETAGRMPGTDAGRAPGPTRGRSVLAAAALAVAAGMLSGAGWGGVIAVGIPLVVACILGLLGEVPLFLAIITAISGVGFYWFEGGLTVGGRDINISGLHWGLVLLTSAALLLRARLTRLPRPLFLYAGFLGLACVALLWTPAPFEGMKQLLLFALPAAVAAVVIAYVRDTRAIELILGSFWVAFLIAIAVAIGMTLPRWWIGEPAPLAGGVGDRTLAIFLLPIMALGLASARYRSRWFLWVVMGVVLVGLASLSRTAVAVLLVLLLFATTGLPRSQRVLVLCLSVLVFVGALQVDAFRERFGGGRMALTEIGVEGQGSKAALTVGGLNTSGRGWMWLHVGGHALERPVLGHGTGSATAYMQALPGSPVAHPHNDYLRVFHDLGAIGLVMILAFGLGTLLYFRRAFRTARTRLGRELALASYLATLAYGLIAVTDNPLLYGTFFTQNVFTLYGLALVARRLELAPELPPSPAAPAAAAV